MRGLVIKDILNLKQQAKIYVGMLILFFAVGLINGDNLYFGSIMAIFMILIPMTAMGYDEKTNWDGYALTMPITRKEIVDSKYVLSVLVLAVVMILSMVGSLIITADVKGCLRLVLTVAPVALIINDVFLPLIFKYGVEKSRGLFLGLFVLICLICFIIDKLDINFSGAQSFVSSPVLIIIILWVAAATVTVCSAVLSNKIYEVKDF